ncbi:hypothetical protein AaE_009702 [Aphanomyces astaci]|uniref:Uncharacterized protein n=1 Tax=Aphanomyces astaci TaxID=112090 RepID=A0A6A5A7I4_APHAT|nr:hypothetical protein AaE_009702 [Aphanomyces astaci]
MTSHSKTLLRERLAAFMGPRPDEQTRDEFRMAYLEHIVDEVIADVDVNRLHRCGSNTSTAAEKMEDMEVAA